jgi:hypothetical protein
MSFYHRIEIITETELIVYTYISEEVANNGGSSVSTQSHPLPENINEWASENGFQLGEKGYFKELAARVAVLESK